MSRTLDDKVRELERAAGGPDSHTEDSILTIHSLIILLGKDTECSRGSLLSSSPPPPCAPADLLNLKMDNKWVLIPAALVGFLCVAVSTMSIPRNENNPVSDDREIGLSEERRAQWLDTRDLEEQFKELVLLSVMELENEGRLAPGIVEKGMHTDKRGRWQGFCFRRTKTGRFLPYICWKGGRK